MRQILVRTSKQIKSDATLNTLPISYVAVPATFRHLFTKGHLKKISRVSQSSCQVAATAGEWSIAELIRG